MNMVRCATSSGCLVLALAAGFAVSMAGCDTRSPASQAVTTAANKVNEAGLKSPSAEEGAPAMNNAVSGLTGLSGTEGEQASAALLQSQSSISAGEAAAAIVQVSDRGLRIQLSELVELGNQWSRVNSRAVATESFDPTKELAALAAQAAEKDRLVGELRHTKGETEKRLADLRKDAKTLSDEATALHKQAAQLTQKAGDLSARQGVAIVEQASQLRRQGDAKRLSAEQITSQADQIVPQATELGTLITQYENQKANLVKSQESLRARQALSRQEVDEARQQAASVAQQIDTQVAGIMRAHSEEYMTAFDKAVSSYNKASGEAGKAGNGAGATLTKGSAQLALAGLQRAHGQLLSSMASTIELLAQTKPPLPNASDLSAKAAALKGDEATAAESAKGALESAKAAFSSVQIKNRADKERLESLSTMLEKMAAGADATAVDAAAVPALEEAPAAEAPVAAAEDIPAGAKALIESMANGGKKLDDAFKAKFNTTLQEAVMAMAGGQMPPGAMGGGMSGMGGGNIDPSKVKYTKTEAGVQVDIGQGMPPLDMVEKDGKWQFSGQAGQMLNATSQAMNQVATRIEAGEFADAPAAVQAFMQAIAGAMMGGMGMPKAPPGGG